MSAVPLRLEVDTDDPTPPYEQLRRQLETAVRHGTLPPGHRLPPIRQLARDLGLAVGTVARTYRELESAGLVSGARGGGTRVQPGAATLGEDARREGLRRLAEAYVTQARLSGADSTLIIEAVARALR